MIRCFKLTACLRSASARLLSERAFFCPGKIIDPLNQLHVKYFRGESFLCERAFQSTALCRYALVFTDWGEGTGRYPAPRQQ